MGRSCRESELERSSQRPPSQFVFIRGSSSFSGQPSRYAILRFGKEMTPAGLQAGGGPAGNPSEVSGHEDWHLIEE